jgi:hypothetical protein
MLGYHSPNASMESGLPPTGEPMGDMMGQPQYPMQQMQPQPLANRLPASRLIEMYNAWEQAKAAEIVEQYTASRYYHSKQWTDSELKALKKRKQPPTVKNRIKRKVDFLVGVEQGQRRDPKGVSRVPDGEKAAFVGTAGLRYVQDVTKFPAIASDCANDGLVRGIGACCTRIVQIKGRPEIRKWRVASDTFFYDPRSERWDFSDTKYLGEARWVDIEEAKEMMTWPGAAEMIDQLGAVSSAGGQNSVLPQLFDKERNWIDTKARRIFLVSIWYKHEGNWMWDCIVGPISLCPGPDNGHKKTDPATGEEYICPPMDCLSPYVDEDGKTCHEYEAWSPYVDETGTRYGVIRDMIPIQDEINKRSSKALHLLTVRQTKAEKGAVDDVDKMKTELAKPDGHVDYNKGFNFEVMEQTAQIQGNLELLQEAKAEIENLGPNPGLIGRGVENQSGRAILAQQNSGMTELSPVFERLREWKLKCYRRDWNLIRQFWTDERHIRVTGNPKAPEFLSINRPVVDPRTGQVVGMENAVAEIDIDIILDEGPDTVTMREELMQQLSQLGSDAVPPELLIWVSNISEKEEMLQKMAEFKQPPPEMAALAKRMGELEEMLKAADVDKKQAEVEKTRADTAKTLMEVGLPPDVMGQAFPFYYREPTTLETARGMVGGGQQPQGMPQNALAGPGGMQGGPEPMEQGMAPPNQLGGPEPLPDGLQGLPIPPGVGEDFLAASSTPWEQPNELMPA